MVTEEFGIAVHQNRYVFAVTSLESRVAVDVDDLDAKTRDFVLRTAERAGLKLNDVQTTILLETAPFALAMAERIRKPRERMEEPSLVFRFPKF